MNSPPGTHTNSSLSSVLKKDETTTHISVKSLLEKQLVSLSEPREKNRRYIDATDKGAIHTFLIGNVDYEGWVEKYGDRDSKSQLEDLKLLVPKKDGRKRLYRVMHNFVLINNLFDKEGNSTLTKSAYYSKLARLEVFKESLAIKKEDPSAINMKQFTLLQKGLEKDFNLKTLLDVEI